MQSERRSEARKDFRHLLDRGYRRDVAMRFVGNHYKLTKSDRTHIMRMTYSKIEIQETKLKKISLKEMMDNDLIVDGYNVLITTEAALKKRAILCDDGVLRDTEGIFGKYKITNNTFKALKIIESKILDFKPRNVLFLFDSQVSRSGEMCHMIGLDAKTSKRVDFVLKRSKKIVATSDSGIIKKVKNFVDIPLEIYRNEIA